MMMLGPRDRALPIAIFLGALLIYLATLTQVHTFDALSYVTSVERKPWTELFHPHHLAYGPLGALALGAGRLLGFPGGAALPMQVVNALAGALGAALYYRLVARVTDRPDVGLAAALLLAGSYAYWYYAVEIEVYTVGALLLIVCLMIMARPGPPTPLRMAALGLAQAGAVLFHQTNALLCVPVLLWYLATDSEARSQEAGARSRKAEGRTQDPSTRATEGGPSGSPAWPFVALRGVFPGVPGLGAYGMALGVGVLAPYLWVGYGVSGFRSLDAFTAWLTEYARTGWWGGPLTGNKWADLGKGVSETLLPVGGGWLWAALLLAGVFGAWNLRGAQPGRPGVAAIRPLVIALAGWLLVYGGFFLWWEPDNIEFWIASLPPALLLLALALRGVRPWSLLIWLMIALAAVMIGINFDAIRRRGDAATDLQRTIARELAARSTPADLLLIPDGLQELYLPYYERRENFLSINQAMFDAGGVWDGACDSIRARIATARYAGATAIIADEVLQPPQELLERHRLRREQVDSCFAPYRDELMTLDLPASVPAYLRLPTAQELVDGPGWRFDHTSQGWRAANITGEAVDQGWRLVPAVDSSLTSPLLRIDTARYQAIEIRLANGTAARDAQLFLIGEDGQTTEGRSVRWELQPGSEPQTYQVMLRGTAGWNGIVTRMRLDPVGVGDGGEIRVEALRLIPSME